MIILGPFKSNATVDVDAMAAAVVARLGAGRINVTSPISQDGEVTISAGDDYTADRALRWSGPGWPDLTGATITLSARSRQTGSTFTTNGSVVVATAGAGVVALELTRSQTETLELGDSSYRYELTARLPAGSVITLAESTITVRE